MTTQVAIWFVGLPSIILMVFIWGNPLTAMTKSNVHFIFEVCFTAFVWFIISMAVSGVARFLWDVYEAIPAYMQLELQKVQDAKSAQTAEAEIKSEYTTKLLEIIRESMLQQTSTAASPSQHNGHHKKQQHFLDEIDFDLEAFRQLLQNTEVSCAGG